MSEIPAGAIPAEQFEAGPAAPEAMQLPEGAIPADQFETQDQAYGTTEQKIKTALEGAAQGVAGPLAPYLEQKLGVNPEDILGRQKANPIIHGTAEAAGLVGSMFTPVPGLGAGLEAVGRSAQVAAKLAEPASFGAKVGSAAVKAAAEMAVLQGSDEASKMVLKDPETSAESAIANVGLAGALGGAAGGFLTGVVSPLWEAAAKPHLERALTVMKNRWNGVGVALPEELTAAEQALGLQMPTEMKAANSSANLAETYKSLKSAGNESIKSSEDQFKANVENSILTSIGRSPEEFVNYDAAASGREAMNAFKEEIRNKFEPISQKFEELTEPFKNAVASEKRIAELADKVTSLANEKGWMAADVPQKEIVDAVVNRLPGIKTAEDMKKAITQISNVAQKNPQALSGASRAMIDEMLDAQHAILGDAIEETAPHLMEKYMAARSEWAAASKVGSQLSGELALGKYTGPESLLRALEAKRSPEQFLSRLSPHGNAEILSFLQEHFPQTLEHIRENELKKIIAPAIKSAKGDSLINLKTLQNKIASLKAGNQSLVDFALPPELAGKIEAADKLMGAIPGSSSYANHFEREVASMPQTALGAISYLMGDGFLKGYGAGTLLRLIRGDVPQAIKLGMLRFAAADQPVKAGAFRASVDFMANALKNQKLMTNASKAVFTGGKVLPDKLMPNKADREKLDKTIDKLQESPDSLMNLTKSEVGHYMPDHQTALTAAATRQVQYLQQIKPKPFQASPLDRPIEPSEAQMSRYNRALDIANQPYVVLEHVKNGTIQQSDLQDLNAMYPGMYKQMVQQLSNQMIQAAQEGEQIPYKTKIGLSLFLGQPLDSSMSPMSIVAAQPKPKVPSQMPQNAGKKTGSPSKLGQKMPSMYQTPGQNAEKDRSSRD